MTRDGSLDDVFAMLEGSLALLDVHGASLAAAHLSMGAGSDAQGTRRWPRRGDRGHSAAGAIRADSLSGRYRFAWCTLGPALRK